MIYRRRFAVAFLSALAVALAAAKQGRLLAGDKPAAESSSNLAKELIGTWVQAGTPEKVEEPPAEGGSFKFFTGKHWSVTQVDPGSGEVRRHHGGTYTLDGENYEETVLYATKDTADQIKKKFKFKVKVEGNTYTQIGVDNPYNEVWKRAK